MSDQLREDEIERLVEKQARGEVVGLPVDEAASGAGQLDTRRSKSGFGAQIVGQTVHVDIPGAEVDSPAFVAHQTGVDRLASSPAADHGLAADHSATIAGREVDVAYPDAVDRPEYIEAHMRPGLGDVPSGIAHSSPDVVAQGSDSAPVPPVAASDPNLYPDAVDRPEYIAGHSSSPLAPDSERLLAQERTPETEVHSGPSQPA